MPKCPYCKQKIDTVRYEEYGTTVYSKRTNEWIKGKLADIETFCLECGEQIYLSELEGEANLET